MPFVLQQRPCTEHRTSRKTKGVTPLQRQLCLGCRLRHGKRVFISFVFSPSDLGFGTAEPTARGTLNAFLLLLGHRGKTKPISLQGWEACWCWNQNREPAAPEGQSPDLVPAPLGPGGGGRSPSGCRAHGEQGFQHFTPEGSQGCGL